MFKNYFSFLTFLALISCGIDFEFGKDAGKEKKEDTSPKPNENVATPEKTEVDLVDLDDLSKKVLVFTERLDLKKGEKNEDNDAITYSLSYIDKKEVSAEEMGAQKKGCSILGRSSKSDNSQELVLENGSVWLSGMQQKMSSNENGEKSSYVFLSFQQQSTFTQISVRCVNIYNSKDLMNELGGVAELRKK